MSYPILECLDSLKETLQQQRITILQAPPGAGKSTILPLRLLEEPWLGNKKIVMLEPRRLAARSVARRMASLRDEQIGETVGYRIRFEHMVSDRTRIEVITEGILTRMIQTDNALEDTGLLIFDEFHERSLHADLALALSLQVQTIVREDLRILIMSATLDGDQLAAILGNAGIITSQGRQHPVSVLYNNKESDTGLAEKAAFAVIKALREQQGDILAFLPGAGEIRRAGEILQGENIPAIVCPLYGELPFARQQEAILPDPAGSRKVVLATSIAETSLTIEDIATVVDCGFSRVPRFDPRSGLTRLDTVRVTRDSADQRAGRAGRLGPGVCYRLWTEATHRNLLPHRQPEILEADLAPLILELAQWGIKNINELTWITPPPAGAVAQAKELLHQLEALEDDAITTRGKEMLRLPTHPRIAHMLITARDDMRLLLLATDIAALLEERDPLPKEAGADLSLRVELLRKWRRGEKVNASTSVLERIERLAASWRKLFKAKVANDIPSDEEVGMLLAAAYPERIARQIQSHGERYKLANARVVKLPPHDLLLRNKWLAVAHLDAGNTEGRVFLAAPVNEEDLHHLATEQESVRWDEEREMLTAATEKMIGNLVLERKTMTSITSERRIQVLCNTIREKGLPLIGWDEKERLWQARILSLSKWRPEENWPDVSDERLIDTLAEWLGPFLHDVTKRTDFQRLDLAAILSGLLPWELQASLDVLVPLHWKVPSGSQIPLHYSLDGSAPVMKVRLQEVFGMHETPVINGGRTKIMVHLLSPGYRPVQVTQDMKSFWDTTYREVRKELRTRYPKHYWPEDPWTAQAVRGVKKKTK